MNIVELNKGILSSLFDPILDSISLGFIKRCIFNEKRLFRGDYCNNDLYDTTYTSDELISKFPKCSIIIGSHDPLREESHTLLEKFLKNNVVAEMHELFYHCHGFMNLPPFVDSFYQQGVDLTIKILKEEVN